ncbi:hypothetical protein DBR32_13815 [Taibaiella sp. KBW10]|uniref:gliding motility-associated C-terminal domain-containing protein n=1 Tax=Taibaiella sp. KBW10 TaxID=2153357 RepID=UPI000F5AA7FF|nr:gliding motility-associated C-terminal domain-containing protein [Taibaiella sp. KBW10]RQO29985.1 hypothetical protein DBR32_13815 [Taibaiella sp. KBW10]
MGKLLLITSILGLAVTTSWANPKAHDHSANDGHNHEAEAKQSIAFIENKGQWVSEAKYKVNVGEGAMFLTDKGFVYNFLSGEDMQKYHKAADEGKQIEDKLRGHAYKVNFVGANSTSSYTTSGKLPTYQNYFINNDQTKWASNVGLYETVTQHDVYNGVDLKVYAGANNNVKYDFIVKQGANPHVIKFSFDGVSPKLQQDGSLLVPTSINKVVEKAPYTYQVIDGKQVPVASKYKFEKGMLSFDFPNGYNKNYDLVIDPDLIFATFSGGVGSSNYFYAHSTTFDKLGCTYTAAMATNTGWPTTTGAYQTTFSGTNTPSINKYSANGSTLIYSTYFGGISGSLMPNTLRVNDSNQLVMAGNVSTPNMPVTAGAYQSTLNGASDIFVVKFATNGNAILASTYLGGSGMESLQIGSTFAYTSLGGSNGNPADIAFDVQGNIWVVSNSGSTDFPVTATAAHATNTGGYDAVISKLNPNLTSLTYSTYLGGSGWDGAIGIEYNKTTNEVVVAGYTESANFPTSSGAYQTASGGGTDGFVTRISNNTPTILSTTYLGTSGTDVAMRVAFDCGNNIFIAGKTNGNYPVTNTVAQGLVANGGVFLHKLNPTLSSSVASTRTGAASTGITPTAMMVDICGNILISTVLGSNQTGMPLTPDAFDVSPKSFYFAAFEANFSDLLFGSYYGSPSGDHFHTGICRMDPNGVVYQSVCGTNGNFPTTSGSYAPIKLNGGANDNITFKFDFDVISIGMETQSGQGGNQNLKHTVRGCNSAKITFTRGGDTTVPMILHINKLGDATNGTDYQYLADTVYFGAMTTSRTIEVKPLLVPNMPTGQKMVVIEALNPCGCDNGVQNVIKRDTVYILDSLYVGISTPLPAYCPGTQISITGATDPTLNFNWTPVQYDLGSLTINPILLTTRDYTITVRQPNAPATCPPNSKTFHALVEQYPLISMASDTMVCGQDSIPIPVLVSPDSVNYIYNWSPGTGLRATNVATNFLYRPTGVYNYHFIATTPLAKCSATHDIIVRVRPAFQLSNVLPLSGTMVDYGKEVDMSASGALFYSWFPTNMFYDPDSKNARTFPVLEPKTYSVVGVDEYGCKDTADIKLEVKYPGDPIMPNAFTPNGDGKNDVFGLTNAKFQKLLQFEIYNRWGQQVFTTSNPMTGWDGTLSGDQCAQGVYSYIIRVELPNKTIKTYKGDVTLYR